jgi:N-acyl-D-amino-acid deacylase
MSRAAFLVLLSCFLSGCGAEPTDLAGTVIVNAYVVDGSGGESRKANVRIVADRIATLGQFEPSAADTVIDARGLVLAPGFIDTHSHHDLGLLQAPGALAAVSQGITTIIVGQDGEHTYPLAEHFGTLETSPAAVNVASYAGHGTLRKLVMGDDYQRHATEEEVAAMVAILGEEMQAGALGFGSGLEYDPGSFSATEELVQLAKEAARYKGRYISHIRSEDQFFWEAIEEIIRIGREAQLPVQVSHIKLAMSRWWGQSDRLIAMLDEARESGVDISADIYPYRAWNTKFSWLLTLFPERDPTRREGAEFILHEMLAADNIVLPEFLPDRAYDGMTIAEVAGVREQDAETTLMELLQAELAFDSAGSEMLGIAMEEADIESIMAWPHTVIGSDGELAGVHPRGFGAFTRYLGHYIRDRQVLSLEEGVRRMTSLSAQQVGIDERGLIEVGRFADLVLFDPETVMDKSSIKTPHVPSVGIEKVWVNGQLVFADGDVTGNLPGQVIRRPVND